MTRHFGTDRTPYLRGLQVEGSGNQDAGGGGPQQLAAGRGEGKKESRPVLLRPQDKWAPLSTASRPPPRPHDPKVEWRDAMY